MYFVTLLAGSLATTDPATNCYPIQFLDDVGIYIPEGTKFTRDTCDNAVFRVGAKKEETGDPNNNSNPHNRRVQIPVTTRFKFTNAPHGADIIQKTTAQQYLFLKEGSKFKIRGDTQFYICDEEEVFTKESVVKFH
jgi:hypothetical protein